MQLFFRQVENKDKPLVLALFKNAAEKISKKNIDHWQYWKNPPLEKITWVEEGIRNSEFFFIETSNNENLGMVRILEEDTLYWGQQTETATYIHSLVIKEKYNGKGIGTKVIEKIANNAAKNSFKYMRLDADAKNQKLCNYYEQLGFKKVGTKKMPLSINNLYQKKLEF